MGSAGIIVDDAEKLFNARDYAAAEVLLDEVIEGEAFDYLSQARQDYALTLRAWSALYQRQTARAGREFRELTEREISYNWNWYGRVLTSVRSNDLDDAVTSLATLAQVWPDYVAGIHSSEFIRIVDFAAPASGQPPSEAYIRLLLALVESGWSRADPAWIGNTYLEFASAMIERGQLDSAQMAINLIRDSRSLVAIDVDRRFDALRELRSEPWDAASVAAGEIAAWQSHLEANPRSLYPVIQLASVHRIHNDPLQALAVIDEVLATDMTTDEAAERWYDWNRYLGWLINERALALWDMGRFETALEDFELAHRISTVDISHTINLALFYSVIGRTEDARRLRPNENFVSDYGETELRLVGVISALYENDDRALGRAMNALERESNRTTRVYLSALIITGRDEEAIDLLRNRLEDPEERLFSLLEAQDHAYADRGLTPLQRDMRERVRNFYARADVRAIINEYGRVRSYPFQGRRSIP